MLSRRVFAVLVAVPVLALALGACHSSGPQPPPDLSCGPCEKILGDPATAPLCLLEPSRINVDKGPFPNLVFEGGGVKGIAYAGALAVMEDHDLMRGVDAVAGTSAGSIVSLAVALGYNADEIQGMLQNLEFTKFEDSRFPWTVGNLVDEYGLYPGDYALCFLRCMVKRKTGEMGLTFEQLEERRGDDPSFKSLSMVATDVRQHQRVIFSVQHHPTMPIADAARMSMSFPYFFAATTWEGEIFVDGGVVDNYPLDVFEADPDTVLGFHLGSAPPRGAPIGDLVTYTEEIFTTLTDVQVATFCNTPADVRRSVIIDPCGIPTLDFAITPAEKCELIRSGAAATERWLAAATPCEACPEWLQELLPPVAATRATLPACAKIPSPCGGRPGGER